MRPFTGNFTQQEPLSDEAIDAAVDVMRSGRLHRYNVVDGEMGAVSALERAYADWQGARFCLACTSGGYAMGIALRAAGVEPGDAVLTNAFTLAPVPGAIAGVGANAVLVEIDENLVIDLDDLAAKIDRSGAKVLLLSHMRGHIADMDALVALLSKTKVQLIEDCAHTMGARWNGKRSGSFGLAGCFSTQTYKHMNSGEGGLVVSDDADFMARATMLSGSYMLYDRHGAGPHGDVYEAVRLATPNLSGRMDNLRASVLLPQLAGLDANIERWNARHDLIAERLMSVPGIAMPHRPDAEFYVGSSIQFRLPGIGADEAGRFLESAAALGVELKWFGSDAPVGFTSNHHSWFYLGSTDLPRTDAILAGLFDMRIPLTFSKADCAHIADIIAHCVATLASRSAA